MIGSWERQSVEAVLGAIFPSGEAGVPGAQELDLIGIYQTFVNGLIWPRGPAVRAAFVAAALGLPLLMLGRARTLGSLEQAARERCLDRLVGHKSYWPRQAGLMLKATASLVYFQHPRVRQAFALPPIADTGGPIEP